jgi:hypothetical protein
MFIKERCSRCGNELRVGNGSKPNCFFCEGYSNEAVERQQWFRDEQSCEYGKVWYRFKDGTLRTTLFNPHYLSEGLMTLVLGEGKSINDILSSNNQCKIYLADGVDNPKKFISVNGTPVRVIKNCKQEFLKSLVQENEN